MDISVAIITYNRADAVETCLKSLAKQTAHPSEIIIVDSSESPGTREVAEKYKRLGVRYKHTGKRVFQPAARNIALRMAAGDIIAFIDDDAVASETWLEGVLESYGGSKVAGATGPAINADESLKAAEKIMRSPKNQNKMTFTGEILSESRRWVPPAPVPCTVMLGANMTFLRSALLSVGGFDEYYGRRAAFREESDPQIALVKRGFHFIYNPKAFVWHVQHKTGGVRSSPRKDYYYWCGVNHRYMVDKHGYSKFWTRLSWLTFSRSPPSLPLGIALALIRRDFGVLQWYKGLFGSSNSYHNEAEG